MLLIETNPFWGISYLDLNVQWDHKNWESHLLVSCLQNSQHREREVNPGLRSGRKI